MSEVEKEHPSFPHFDAELSPNYGYVGTWEDAKAMKEFFEIRKALRFPALRTSTTFGKTDILKLEKKKKYKWAEADEYVSGGAIPYDGIPFIILDKNIYECEYGVDHKLKRKARRGHKQNQENDVECNTKKKQGAEADMGKKRNCPAKIRMKEVMKFPDFQIDVDTRYNRNKVAENLNTAIAKGAVRGERRIYIYFPSDSEHRGHEVRSQVCATKQHVDGRVLCLIDHLVEEGVTLAEEISQQIRLCVQDAAAGQSEEGNTNPHAKLTCPEDGDIKYHIQAAQVIHTYSKLQPEQLEDHVAQLRLIYEDPYIIFRKQSAGKSLLLVHQTMEQQQTIARYANERYFLDSTCKTTKQALPLILISVEAGGIQQIVGSAILQEKSSSLIQEALDVFKSWNRTWKPLSFTTEFEEEDVEGIKEAFQGVPVLLCDYHRVSAWNKWVSETRNGMMGIKGALLPILEALSNASTRETYDKLLNQLQSSSYWTEDERLHTWFGNKWLPRCTMWSQAFFPQSSSSPLSEDPPPEDPPDDNEEEVSDIALTATLRERCLQTLQRLTDIAQQETTNQQDLAHLTACLDSAEEKYASLVAASGQGVAEQGEEEAQERQHLEEGEGWVQEPEQGEENHLVVEGFEAGSMKRRRVETDSVKTGNIEVGQEPIFLDMFVEAVEIVYRNQETLNQEMVTSEVHQELVTGEVHQELVTDEIHQELVTAEVHQELVTAEVHQEMVTAEVHQEMVTAEVRQEMVAREVHQKIITGEVHQEMVTNEVHEELVTGEVHQERVTSEVHQDMITGEVHQEMVTSEVHS